MARRQYPGQAKDSRQWAWRNDAIVVEFDLAPPPISYIFPKITLGLRPALAEGSGDGCPAKHALIRFGAERSEFAWYAAGLAAFGEYRGDRMRKLLSSVEVCLIRRALPDDTRWQFAAMADELRHGGPMYLPSRLWTNRTSANETQLAVEGFSLSALHEMRVA